MIDRRRGTDRRTADRDVLDRRGRPSRVPGQLASERVWVRLTPKERADLKAVATENGKSVGEVLRDAMNEYVADYQERTAPLFVHP